MKKIISYITIFLALYLQLSLANPNEVNADETLNVINSNIIEPESTGITLDTGNQNTDNQTNTSNQDTTPTTQNENNTQVNTGETYFLVTAYYSPLPNQEHYLRGNYQDEIILNGKGIRGASGKDVFAGMFAGPKSYSFGTKIQLEGVGVGEISDRGGAIVSASGSDSRGYQYDRIDIWMGYGEEGLKRALAWGKRIVKGKILQDNNTPVSVNLSNFPAPDYVVKNLVNKPYFEKSTDPRFAIFDKYIGPESSESRIIELQKLLSEMGIYAGNIDGKYDSVKDSLISYQIKLGVINLKSDNGAGVFGPKTRTKAKADYIAFLDAKTKLIEEKKKKEIQLALIKENIKNKVEKHIENIGSPKFGDVGENVRTLQKTLKILGYLNVKDSAIFGEKTKLGLIKYQLDKGIIKNKNESGAGVFGPKTKETLKNELVVVLEKHLLKEKNLLSYKK